MKVSYTQFISINNNMDTKCVKGIPIKLTLWINLEKLEGKSWDFGNQIEKLDRWQNIKKLNTFEKLETNIPAFESV